MAFTQIFDTTTGYAVAGSHNSYLVTAGTVVGSSGVAIFASGSNTNNDYTIDGYVIGNPNSSGIYLGGKDGTIAGTNTVEIGANGIVSAGTGIHAYKDKLVLTNNGSISGDSYDAVRAADVDVNGHVIINNGDILGYNEGIDLVNGASTIVNSGSVHSRRGDGIYIGTGGNTIDNSGLISTGSELAHHGIYAAGGENTIDNSGTVSSDEGGGIRFYGGSNLITNSGLIRSYAPGIYVRNGSNVISNSGEIFSDSYAVEFSSGGDDSLTNSGTLRSTSDTGVNFTDSGNTLYNSVTGEVYSGNFGSTYGVQFQAGSNNSVENHGLVSGSSYGVYFTAPDAGPGFHTLLNTGSISGSSFGGVYMSGGSGSITNSGLITSTGSLFAIFVNDGDNTITNTGEISGHNGGVLFNTAVDTNAISNFGVISAENGIGILSYSDDTFIYNSADAEIVSNADSNSGSAAIYVAGIQARIVNEGAVSAASARGIFSVATAYLSVDNTGTIGANNEAIASTSDTVLIKNSGMLSSTSSATIDSTGVNDNFRLINSGTISNASTVSAAINVSASDTEVQITNKGFITSGNGSAIDATTTLSGGIFLRNFGAISGDVTLEAISVTIRSQTGEIDGAIRLEGNAQASLFLGDEDNTVIDYGMQADRFDLGGGADYVNYLFSTAGVHVDLAAGRGYSGYARGDILKSVEEIGGSEFEDLLLGSSVANYLDGDDGDDVIDGRGGDDRLFGRAGNDDILGGSGDDLLRGGEGGDDLIGGTGADVFIYLSALDSAVTGIGRDRILDFEQGVDLIDLSDMGIEAFINQAAFTGTGTSEVRYQNVGGGTKTLVQIDTDGNGTADSAIIINNAFFNLTPDDFALGA